MDFVKYEDLVRNTRKNNKYSTNYLTQLFNYNNDYLKLTSVCHNPLTAIKCFVPLPSRLILGKLYTNKIVKVNDEYTFMGPPGKKIIFADKIIPFVSPKYQSSIPFSFPVYDDDHIEILLSNVFYYELTIGQENNLNTNWINNDVTVGFGSRDISYNSHVGNEPLSFGYSLTRGTIIYNDKQSGFDVHPTAIKVRNDWISNDTIGVGVIYLDTNLIKPFFTYNGSLIHESDHTILLNKPLLPMVGYDFPYSIKLNFSNDKFMFDIKSMIHQYSNNVISTNNSFVTDQDISVYLNDEPYNINTNNLYTNPNFSNIMAGIGGFAFAN